uniref:Placenta associated 8 n=1 Tax=Sphenodon punctatus TaxID=8508 RepID=A0A8D0H3J7_SPHPU
PAQAPVITTQPQFAVVSPSFEWQSDLCDCFADCGVCVCGTFCDVCLGCQIAGDMDECCLCGQTMAMRTLYRTKYRIPVRCCLFIIRIYMQAEIIARNM